MVTFDQRLDEWRAELLDLTNRNRLLNFRTSSSRMLRLQLVAPDSSALFRQLCDEKSLLILGQPDPPNEDSESSAADLDGDIEDVTPPSDETGTPLFLHAAIGQAVSHLTKERTEIVLGRLRKQAISSEQEQGVNILYAAFGLLNWREAEVSETRKAPILLLPIRIELTNNGSHRIAAIDNMPEVNTTLAERLRRDFGIQLDVSLSDESEIDLGEVLERV
ncbi:MAG: DUF4011 domain-containing protein, partial [Thermomicrobiales bacterium]